MTTLTSNPAASSLGDRRAAMLARLRQLSGRLATHLMVAGIARGLAVIAALAVASLLIDWWFRLSIPARLIGLAAGLAAFGWSLRVWLVSPLRHGLDAVGLAAMLDHHAGRTGRADALAPRVASVLQLPEQAATDPNASTELARRAVDQDLASIEAADLSGPMDGRLLWLRLLLMVSLLACGVTFAALKPSVASLWAKRWLMASSQRWPQRTRLAIDGLTGDRMVVPRGEPFTIHANLVPGHLEPEQVRLQWRQGRQPWSSILAPPVGPGAFHIQMPPIYESSIAYVSGGDENLGPIAIEPVDRPRISDLELTASHPAQTQPSRLRFAVAEAPPSYFSGSAIDLTLSSDQPLASVRLMDGHGEAASTLAGTRAGTPAPAAPAIAFQQLDDQHFVARWNHQQAMHMTLVLVSRDTGLESLPTPVSIGLKVDQPPRAMIQVAGVRQRVTPRARLPFTVRGFDDRGVRSLSLAIDADVASAAPATQPSGSATLPPTTRPAPRSIPLLGPFDPATATEVEAKHAIELSPMGLPVGSALTVNSEAQDAGLIGVQTGRSRSLTFRIVSPEELFKDILVRQQAERIRLRKARDAARDLGGALEKMTESFAAADAARMHRVGIREVARVSTTLDESLVEMRLNGLGGAEAWDLMESSVLAPLRKLKTQTLPAQRDALDSLAGKFDNARAAEARQRQQQIVATMDDVLRRMTQWDSFVDVVNQLNLIIQIQNGVLKGTRESIDTESERVFTPSP